MERLSLAQQIAQLEDVAPADLDPEDIQVTGTHSDHDLDVVADHGAARVHYFDVGPSSLRKLHESLSDPKYDGAKTSRERVLAEPDDSDSDSAGEEAESGSRASEAHTEARSSDHETGAEREANARPTINASTERLSTPKHNTDLSSLRKVREEDRKKGETILRQIALWDSLLDARIRLQKSIVAGNRLPPTSSRPLLSRYRLTDEQLSQCGVDQQVHISLVKVLEEARLLSNEIFDFQERLLSINESVQPPPRKRQRNTDTGCSVAGYSEELRQGSHAMSELECAYHPHLVQTLNKWSSKIQAVAPSVLLPSNRNAFSRTSQHIKPAPQLIDETLADHGKVLARTRIYRGKGNRLGVGTTEEDDSGEKEDTGVFDDTDFYHQLLRDVIDARGSGTGGNDDWMAMQKEKRAKKKVDTKASKGRKLRYEVHEKMQNFMVPVPMRGSWHEEQIDELFASLLGKGFESALEEAGAGAERGPTLGGFRIFG